nr:MAG TPA: hypothetical protein [Caudoviricetes sp.]
MCVDMEGSIPKGSTEKQRAAPIVGRPSVSFYPQARRTRAE